MQRTTFAKVAQSIVKFSLPLALTLGCAHITTPIQKARNDAHCVDPIMDVNVGKEKNVLVIRSRDQNGQPSLSYLLDGKPVPGYPNSIPTQITLRADGKFDVSVDGASLVPLKACPSSTTHNDSGVTLDVSRPPLTGKLK